MWFIPPIQSCFFTSQPVIRPLPAAHHGEVCEDLSSYCGSALPQPVLYHFPILFATVLRDLASSYEKHSIAKLSSTPLWNLILQNVALLKVEFNSSYFSLIILYTNMGIPPSSKETIMNKQKHLNLEARILIETMLNEHHSFKSIARELGKDCTTISKEIKARICFEKTGALGRSFNDCRVAFLHQCSLQKFCQHCAYSNNKPCWTCGRCTSSCISYEKYICPKLSKPPYVCNGCQQRTRCSLEKRLYKASYAQKEYEQVRSESRSGFALSEAELKQLDDVVSPLLKKGQSLHHIAVHHADELMKSERTLYTYTNNGLFTARNIDMPRTIRMRPRKNVSSKLKVDKSCRIGRDFHCFEIYMAEHPDASVRQLDSVEGIKGGAVLLTIHFVEQQLQLAFLRQHNDSQSVIDIFDRLYFELRMDIFIELFPVLLADNGSEFSNPSAIELDAQGNPRTRMFYCNPSAPYQKGSCENNHELIRRIIPKGTDLGRYSQEQIDFMMSHINSYSRKKLGNKSPYEVFEFQYGRKILDAFHLQKIPADEIILSPELLK
ncbi:MAG: IS30 family transposase [Mediterraneibacter faecis]